MITRIERVEWGLMEGKRPRSAGCNARLGAHGDTIRMPMMRLHTSDGACGFGFGRQMDQARAEALLGLPFESLFSEDSGLLLTEWQTIETALWDLAGQRAGVPVYALAAKIAQRAVPSQLRVPCYDTSLYIDDLHLPTVEEAARLIANEARAGYELGHRAFKLKIGRGARHLPLEDGMARDIAVIQAVRDAVGPQPPMMLDANNGYNLNLAKRVLSETAGCQILWLEEAFHEDAVLYRDLKEWLARHGLPVLIADGEGEASPSLLKMADQELIDVVQYDIHAFGLTAWLALGPRLAVNKRLAAPHHYGTLYGNYVSCHLAAALETFSYAEWDEATAPGLDGSRYKIVDGFVEVPDLPGFGLFLDEDAFQTAVKTTGWEVQA